MIEPKPFAQHPYADFLHEVLKPARYTGGEVGARVKDWQSVEAKICLAFPDVYDIGMSHLGYKILYKILNDDERTLAERAYAPWTDMEQKLRERGLPLVSHESARPLCDFDVVGLSLQFELTYTNCLTILDLGKITLRAEERGENEPLVLGGGPTATHPEALALFFDAFVVGDGEEACKEVALTWVNLKKQGLTRSERLIELAKIKGVYVPSLYETEVQPDTGFCVVTKPKVEGIPSKIERAFVEDINKYPFPADSPVGGPEAIFDRMSIEIARGCTEGCRFCQAGMIYRPVRERDPEQVINTVLEAVKKTGHDEVSLTSLSTADASCISPLIKKITKKLAAEKVSLGVSSLRAYGLDEDLLDDIKRVGATGLTFAPEAGTQRMRNVINKNVTEEQLLETARRIFSRGWDRMKLYFMIGQPTETDEDVLGVVETGKRAAAQAKLVGNKRAGVTVSVSTHVPKPHTPFQWCAMDSLEEIERKQCLLRQNVYGTKVDLRTHDPRESVLEGIFARGDRQLGPAIEEAWRNGCRFDSWQEHQRLNVWNAAFAKLGIDVSKYLGTIPVTARLPWDHISVGLEDGFLAKEYRQALKGRLSPPCGKAVGQFVHHSTVESAQEDRRKLVCYDCGVACDLTEMRQERIDWLTKMGARRLPVINPAEAPGLAADNTVESTLIKGDEADVIAEPKPAVSKAPTYRYRFSFEKTGPVVLLGHLDLVRAIPRVFRRLEIPLVYTQGFHPKPDLVFSPALSLGAYSLAEYVDLKLHVDVDPTTILERMNAAVPVGLRFTSAIKLGLQDSNVGKRVGFARYAIVFAAKELPEGLKTLESAIAKFHSVSELIITRDHDGIKKKLDVKKFVRKLDLQTEEAIDAVGRVGIVGDLHVIDVTVEFTQTGTVKAAEIAEALVGEDISAKIIRMALFDDQGRSPMELVPPAPKPLEQQVPAVAFSME